MQSQLLMRNQSGMSSFCATRCFKSGRPNMQDPVFLLIPSLMPSSRCCGVSQRSDVNQTLCHVFFLGLSVDEVWVSVGVFFFLLPVQPLWLFIPHKLLMLLLPLELYRPSHPVIFFPGKTYQKPENVNAFVNLVRVESLLCSINRQYDRLLIYRGKAVRCYWCWVKTSDRSVSA